MLAFFATLAICFAVAGIGFETIKEWQTLIAGVLALGGAGLVLVATDQQIKHAKEVANESRETTARSALMHVLLEFDQLQQRCERIAFDCDIWLGSGGCGGKVHGEVPVPDFAKCLDVVRLPQAPKILEFVALLREINDTADAIREFETAMEVAEFISTKGAVAAIRAFDWRRSIRVELGWAPPQMSTETFEQLLEIASRGPHAEDLSATVGLSKEQISQN